jgi:hypothetical protein
MAFTRASVSRIRVSVNSTAIQSLYEPGGGAWNFAQRLGGEFVREAMRRAPMRTGRLASMHGFTTTPIGRFQVRTTLYNDASYAKYVSGGTNDIYGNMVVRAYPHSYYRVPTRRHHVRGQRANPWMERSVDIVLSHYAL